MRKMIDDYIKASVNTILIILISFICMLKDFQDFFANHIWFSSNCYIIFNILIVVWLLYDMIKHHSWATYPVLRMLLIISVYIYGFQRGIGFFIVVALVLLTQIFEYLILKINQNILYIYANFPNQKFKTTVPKDYFVLSLLQIGTIVVISIVLFLNQFIPNIIYLAILIAFILFALYGYVLMKNYYANKENDYAFEDFDRLINEYQPDYLVFVSYPENGILHYSSWHEHLEKFNKVYGKKSVFITSFDYNYFEMIKAYPDLPVYYAPYTDRANRIAIDSVKAVIYVNPDQANMKFTRMTKLNHLMINHGDSDKSASAHKNYRMFDKNFVAGNAAVKRFKDNNIILQNDFFEIVGRPQLKDVEVVNYQNSNKMQQKTVMYAPTWYGIGDDAHYSSQDRADEIIDALLSKNVRIIYRSHPLSRVDNAMGVGVNWSQNIKDIQAKLADHAKSTGIKHIFGTEAEDKYSIYELFNMSDALISDISSVVSDYIYSEKPFAIVSNKEDTNQFIKENYVANAAYVVDYNIQNIQQTFDNLLFNDNKQNSRQEIKKFYLGDFSIDKSGDEYEKVFFEALNQYL